jgi:hypothetical protein
MNIGGRRRKAVPATIPMTGDTAAALSKPKEEA